MHNSFIDSMRVKIAAFLTRILSYLNKNDDSQKTLINKESENDIKIISCKVRYVKKENEN